MTIVATLTVFNRVEMTLKCLDSFFAQCDAIGVECRARLVDDGSNDGTGSAVRNRFGDRVDVIAGTGALFWAAGMSLAQSDLILGDGDYVLWLNNDIVLSAGAVESLLNASQESGQPSIVVGATAWEGEVTYTGASRMGRAPTRLRPVPPSGTIQPIDAFNGNVVLVSSEAFKMVGPIDGGFPHAFGDNDYGLRARGLGVTVVLAPAPVAECRRNDVAGTWLDTELPIHRRVWLIFDRKALPPRGLWRYNRRHAGLLLGPFFTVGQYASSFSQIIRSAWRT